MKNIVIGSHKNFEVVEPVIKYSITKFAKDVNIILARPEYYDLPYTGCTGFSNIRFYVPHICKFKGFAIYLDVDMILLSDVTELFKYAAKGKYVCVEDGSTEVAVIDCETQKMKIPYDRNKWEHEKNLNLKKAIPKVWNCEDWCSTPEEVKKAKLIHFTDLKNQPWNKKSPNKPMMKIWEKYAADSQRF